MNIWIWLIMYFGGNDVILDREVIFFSYYRNNLMCINIINMILEYFCYVWKRYKYFESN